MQGNALVITYRFRGTLAAKTLNLSITVDFVIFQNRQLGLLALVLDLLRARVHLFLSFLASTT